MVGQEAKTVMELFFSKAEKEKEGEKEKERDLRSTYMGVDTKGGAKTFSTEQLTTSARKSQLLAIWRRRCVIATASAYCRPQHNGR